MLWMAPSPKIRRGEQMHDSTFNMKLWIAWHPIKIVPGHFRIWKTKIIWLDWTEMIFPSTSTFWWYSRWIRRSDKTFNLSHHIKLTNCGLSRQKQNVARIMVYQLFKAILLAIKAIFFFVETESIKDSRTKAQRTIKHQLQNVLPVDHEIFREFKWNRISFRVQGSIHGRWHQIKEGLFTVLSECWSHHSPQSKVSIYLFNWKHFKSHQISEYFQ